MPGTEPIGCAEQFGIGGDQTGELSGGCAQRSGRIADPASGGVQDIENAGHDVRIVGVARADAKMSVGADVVVQWRRPARRFGFERLTHAQRDRHAKPSDGPGPVFVLRAALRADDRQIGRSMTKPDGRVGLVALLPAGPRGSIRMHVAFAQQVTRLGGEPPGSVRGLGGLGGFAHGPIIVFSPRGPTRRGLTFGLPAYRSAWAKGCGEWKVGIRVRKGCSGPCDFADHWGETESIGARTARPGRFAGRKGCTRPTVRI